MTDHINDIPPELLAHIFFLLAVQQLYGDSALMVVVASICRHWRTIALTSPTLWAFIVIDRRSKFFPQLYLSRSGSCDLDLTIRSAPPEQRDWLMGVLPSIIPRLRSLSISRDFQSLLWPHLCDPAPSLRSLSITYRPPSLSKPLFDNSTPRLSQLHLDGYSSWPRDILRNLTHLHLAAQHSLLTISLPDFLSIIKLNPTLKELILDSAGPNAGFPDHEKVIATNLRRLGMHKCQGRMIEFLLSCLTFSPSIAIVVSCPMDGIYPLRSIEGTIPTGFIDSFAFKKACIFAMRDVDNLRVTLANQTAALIFQTTRAVYQLSSVLKDLVAIPSLSLVEELHLSFNSDLIKNSIPIRTWLSALPNLTTLSTWISMESMRIFCGDIHLPVELTSTFVNNETLSSPNLRDVTIHVPPTGTLSYCPRWWTIFSGIAEEREKRGYPISRITVINNQPYLVALQSCTSASAIVTEIRQAGPILMELPDVCAEEVVPGKGWSNCWTWAKM